MLSILPEPHKIEFGNLHAIFLHSCALGGGSKTSDAIGVQPINKGKGEVHLAHNVDGRHALYVNDFVVIIINELFDVGFVAVRVYLRERKVDDLAAAGGELSRRPRGGGVVGEV